VVIVLRRGARCEDGHADAGGERLEHDASAEAEVPQWALVGFAKVCFAGVR
jgi:hypothetical protein